MWRTSLKEYTVKLSHDIKWHKIVNTQNADAHAVLVRKSVTQRYNPSKEILSLMESFRQMVNDCIRIGLEFDEKNHRTPSMKKLSLLCYRELGRYGGYSQYRLTAISKAAGILSARKKSIKRGFPTNNPYVFKHILVSCYNLKIENGCLMVQLSPHVYESISLNSHTLRILSDPTLKVRSFTLTERSLSLCVSKEVREMEPKELTSTVGIDRNLRNICVGNSEKVTFYNITEAVEIAQNTRSIIRSFRRNDVRIRQRIASKYGQRRANRIKYILNWVSKDIVTQAKKSKYAIVFEDITNIRSMYRRGNGQGANYRSRMNSASFNELKRQVEYKAAWEGVPVLTLTKGETRGTTIDCPRCGERLQSAVRGDSEHYRQLWCKVCERWIDRDVAAVMNISRRGWVRFAHSSTEGEAREAVKGNLGHVGKPVILRVDASKLRRCGES